MRISDWLAQTSEGISWLDAELILLSVLEKSEDMDGALDRTYLVSHGEDELTIEQLENADSLVKRRIQGEPIAYLVGKREFYGREFLVDRNVLIPRPETEEIIEATKELASVLRADDDPLLRIWDVGTGSGCIAVTLALELPKAEILATDISVDALKVAKGNAKLLGAEGVKFLQSDLLENVQKELPDILVANLPYVDKKWDFLSPELEFEPQGALFAEEEGLAEVRRLLEQVDERWQEQRNNIYILLESDTSQQNKLQRIASAMGFSVEKVRGFITVLRKG